MSVRFGAIIKRLRLMRGWSRPVAARRIGVHPTYLGLLEKGGNMPSVETLFEVAEVFGISVTDIVREVEEAQQKDRVRMAAEFTAPKD